MFIVTEVKAQVDGTMVKVIKRDGHLIFQGAEGLPEGTKKKALKRMAVMMKKFDTKD